MFKQSALPFIMSVLLLVACESAEDKEIKRLQLERLRMETQLQTQKLNQEQIRAAKEEEARIAYMKAEAERIEREKQIQLAAEQAERDRVRHQEADRFVSNRAEYRVGEIARPLLAKDPSISVVSHDCQQTNGSFTAIVKINYHGGFSGDSLSVGGKLVRNSEGKEHFQYDPIAPDIIGRLAMIGLPDDKLKLLASGQAFLNW